MKILDRTPGAASKPPPVPPVPVPGAFETLLRGEESASGFQDLGMFGRRSIPPSGAREIAPTELTGPDLPAADEAPATRVEHPAPPVARPSAVHAEAFVQAVARATSGQSSPLTRTGIAVETLSYPDAGVVVRRVVFEMGAAEVSTASAPEAQQSRPSHPGSLSLLVADHDGALRIAIGGLTLTRSALAHLKLKIAELAREFGMTLSELSINGDLDLPSPLVPGGLHGDHAG